MGNDMSLVVDTSIIQVSCCRSDCRKPMVLEHPDTIPATNGSLTFFFCRQCWETYGVEKLAACMNDHPERGIHQC
jgi:hypothetical protein